MNRMSLLRAFAAVAVVAAGTASIAHAQGKLEIVGGDTYDWGTVPPGELKTEVQVKNVGSADLKITDVHPGCSCTTSPIDKNLLKPGEIGKISVKLNASYGSGPVNKVVTISSSDSSNPVVTLHLKADVHRAIVCEPMQYMIVNNAKLGTETPASPMKVKNNSTAPITIYRPEVVPGATIKVRFDMKEKVELKPGEDYEVKVFVTPTGTSSISGQLKMKTSSTEMPVIDINVTGTFAAAAPTPAASASPAVGTPRPHN